MIRRRTSRGLVAVETNPGLYRIVDRSGRDVGFFNQHLGALLDYSYPTRQEYRGIDSVESAISRLERPPERSRWGLPGYVMRAASALGLGRMGTQNPAGYFVVMVDDDPPLVRGPYELLNAKQYARIGSQTGGRRAVVRGSDDQPIRFYERGYRIWPVGDEQIEEADLLPDEVPREAVPYYSRGVRELWGMAANPWAPRDGEGVVYIDPRDPSREYAAMVMEISPGGDEAVIQLSTEPWGTRHQVPMSSLYQRIYNNPVDYWARTDTDDLVESMARVIWANELHTFAGYAAEEFDVPFGFAGFVMATLTDEQPKGAETDARRFLTDLKKANDDTPWWDVANALGVDDLDEFGYFVVMQTEGTGVAWSDSREGELITGSDEATHASSTAANKVERLVEQEGYERR